MPFEVYNPLGESVGFIENETEYTWRDMFDGTGSFTITMPDTPENFAMVSIHSYVRNVETNTLKVIHSQLVNRDEITIAGNDLVSYEERSEYTTPERTATVRKVSDLLGMLFSNRKFIPGNYKDTIKIAMPCLPKYEAITMVLESSGFGVEQGISNGVPYVALVKYGETPVQTFSTMDGSVEDWQLSRTDNKLCSRAFAYGSFGDDGAVEFEQYYPDELSALDFPIVAEDIGIVPSSDKEGAYEKFRNRLKVKAQEIYEQKSGTGTLVEYTVNARNKPYMIGQYAKFEIPEIGFSETRRIDGREITVSPGIRDEKIIVGKLYRQK